MNHECNSNTYQENQPPSVGSVRKDPNDATLRKKQ